jgi:xylulokinase
MYDIRARRWNGEWAERIAPGLPLPELMWPTEVVGTVTREAQQLTGIPAGTPVSAGTIDAWAEATSVGIREPGGVMLMYGTTMFLVEVVRELTTHPGVWATTGVWPDSYTIAATLPTSGAVTNWLSALTATDFGTLVAEAGQSPAGANGLLVLPHFEGERTPRFDPDSRGAVAGLTLRHTRGDLYRAALEGIAFGTRQILEAMAAAAGRHRDARLVAVGGGTQGGLWTQIVSDVTGLPQHLCRETVGAALGDALLAGVATGTAIDVDAWNPTVTLVSPDPATAGRYAERFADYVNLGEATRAVAHRLAATQHDSMEHE